MTRVRDRLRRQPACVATGGAFTADGNAMTRSVPVPEQANVGNMRETDTTNDYGADVVATDTAAPAELP